MKMHIMDSCSFPFVIFLYIEDRETGERPEKYKRDYKFQ